MLTRKIFVAYIRYVGINVINKGTRKVSFLYSLAFFADSGIIKEI